MRCLEFTATAAGHLCLTGGGSAQYPVEYINPLGEWEELTIDGVDIVADGDGCITIPRAGDYRICIPKLRNCPYKEVELLFSVDVPPAPPVSGDLEELFTALCECINGHLDDLADDLEEITVTIDTSEGPVEITGEVTIAGLLEALENLNVTVTNFDDLIDLLTGDDVTITVDGTVLIDPDQWQAFLDGQLAIIAAINATNDEWCETVYYVDDSMCICKEGETPCLEAPEPVIFSAKDVSSPNGVAFSAGTPIGQHIDKSGLSTPWTEGQSVAAYDPANQPHVTTWSGNETYLQTSAPITPANPLIIDYDLGAVRALSGVAIWGEEAHPPRNYDIEVSVDGVTYTPLGSFSSTPNTITGGYGASMVELECAVAEARYVRFKHTEPGTYRPEDDLVAIGEIGFIGAMAPLEVPPSAECTTIYQAHSCQGVNIYTVVDGKQVPYVMTGNEVKCVDAEGSKCCDDMKALLAQINTTLEAMNSDGCCTRKNVITAVEGNAITVEPFIAIPTGIKQLQLLSPAGTKLEVVKIAKVEQGLGYTKLQVTESENLKVGNVVRPYVEGGA